LRDPFPACSDRAAYALGAILRGLARVGSERAPRPVTAIIAKAMADLQLAKETDLKAMIDLAIYLKRNGYRPDQVQDFIPAPFDIATCMYYTGIDPFTKQEVYIARNLRDRKMQRALLQFFKPENYFEVREALIKAGRSDLIGGGCDCLIPANPPKEAIEARRKRANDDLHYADVIEQSEECGDEDDCGQYLERENKSE
jgi:hypothetical protein